MGFVGNAVGKITGSLAANNSYNATPAALTTSDYRDAITGAMADKLKPQNGLVDTSQGDQTRAQNAALIAALQAQASGQAPSLAQMQLQDATNKNTQAAAGLIASQKGMNPALAARQILNSRANIQQEAANQSAQTALQSQQSAQQQLESTLANQRQQDIAQAQGNSQVGLETLNANTQRLGTVGGLQNQQNQTNVSNTLGTEQINAGVAAGNTQARNAITGGIISGIAGAGAKAMTGGMAPTASKGGRVPGQAAVSGNSVQNDKVPVMLSPDEVVLPRTVASDGDKAKAFVEALKKAGPRKSSITARNGYGKVLEAHRLLQERVARLEQRKQ